jgi:hypothetical protein
MSLDAYALPPAFTEGEWIAADRAPEIEFRCLIPSSLNGAWTRAMGAAAYKKGNAADMDADDMYTMLASVFWSKFVRECRGTTMAISLSTVPSVFPDLAFEIFEKARALADAMEKEAEEVEKK